MSDDRSEPDEAPPTAPTDEGEDAGDGTGEYDASGEEERRLGRGFFQEEMGPGSAMAHLYRGEIHRMKLWRERLDRTTNWAVIMMSAILTWAFSTRGNPHYILLIGVVLLSVFLGIEARRFRGYDIFRSRVRKLQENVFSYALDPSGDVPDHDWRAELSQDYRTPRVNISFEESLAHRLRRVYVYLYAVMFLAWGFRVTAFESDLSYPATAAIGPIPGTVVTLVVGLFVAALLVVAYRPREWHTEGEVTKGEHRDLHLNGRRGPPRP